jgi:ABC-2 type transport system ATP-binding protein
MIRPNMVEVEHLVKRYRGASRNAVDDVTFTVGTGEFFALLGPNGAGKTTIISILTTTLTPTSGSVRIAGLDARRETSAVRRQVGIIFQNPSMDGNLTGEENIRLHAILFGLYPYRPSYRLMPSGYQRQIAETAARLGMESDMFRPVREMSGGMRRKLEIIRGLMHRPRLLFLDEPTAGLDAASRRSLWAYLNEIRHNDATTIVLTTHYLEEADAADRIVILNDGQVAAQGSPADIKAQLGGESLEIDAEDRSSLRRELLRLKVPFTENGRFVIRADDRSAYQLVRSLAVPLSVMRTRQASLEDAYLRILGNE